jgi:hypothetical protein
MLKVNCFMVQYLVQNKKPLTRDYLISGVNIEREAGFEPVTFSLGSADIRKTHIFSPHPK